MPTGDVLARKIDLSIEDYQKQLIAQNKKIGTDISLLRDFFTPVPISGVTYKIINGRKIGYRSVGVWDEKRGGGYDVTYEHTETYVSTTTNINLDFNTQVIIKRIELIWDDATAKGYELRAYSDKDNSPYYSLLKKETGNTDTRDILRYDFVYPAGSRLQFYFDNYTPGKICKILVAIEEL